MVNKNRIPLEMMLNKTESNIPRLYDSAFISLQKNMKILFTMNLFEFPFGKFKFATEARKYRKNTIRGFQFCVSVPMWQSYFAEGKVSHSKITVQI